jgi:hypothetical protein
VRLGIEAAPLGWLLVSRIVAGNDRGRALTGIRRECLTSVFLKIGTRLLENWVSYTHVNPIDLK